MRTTHGDITVLAWALDEAEKWKGYYSGREREEFGQQIQEAREALEHVKEDRKTILREVMG